MSYTIYHNPRCSKSRQTLALLTDQGVEVEIIEYLKNPPSISKLSEILKILDLTPRELMRTKEDVYKAQNLDNADLTTKELIKLMVENPKLIERPIVLFKGKGIIGRPPENVLNLK